MRPFLTGFIAAIVVAIIAVIAGVQTGVVPANADGGQLPGEKWMAQNSLRATVAREAPKPPYPFSPTDEDILTGAQLYVRHCSVCHGTGSSGPSTIAHGLYVEAPQFAKHDVMDDSEGETYWKIEHGIRFTGMPSYGGALSEKEIWQLTFFMKDTPDHLPAKAKDVWDHAVPANFPTLPPGVKMRGATHDGAPPASSSTPAESSPAPAESTNPTT